MSDESHAERSGPFAAEPAALAVVRARLAGIKDPLAMLEGIFAFAPVGLQVYKADGHSLLVNQAFRSLFGADPPPEYNVLRDEIAQRSGVLGLIHRAFAGETVHVPATWYDPRELTQIRVMRARRIAVEATFFPLYGDGGRVEHVGIVYKDMTSELIARQAALIEHDRHRLLADAGSALAPSLDYEATIASIARLAVPAFADGCTVHMIEPDGSVRCLAIAHVDPAKVEIIKDLSMRMAPDTAIGPLAVIRRGQVELISEIADQLLDATGEHTETIAMVRALGLRSFICAPLIGFGGVIGAISFLATDSRRRFASADLPLAEELARRSAVAIESARLYAAERRSNERLALLARIGGVLSSSIDYETTLHNIVEMAMPALADFSFFDVVEQSGDVRRIARARGDAATQALLEGTRWAPSARQDVNICALSSGRSGFHPDVGDAWMRDVAVSPEHLDLLRRLAFCSLITVPLIVRDRRLGALTLCFAASGRHHTAEDLSLAEELARRAAIAVENAALYRASREAAERAEEASRSKDEFLSIVSHELRTPLNAILGWASILMERAQEPQVVAKGLATIERNARAQVRIIGDILDVSRIITGRLRLSLHQVDLESVIGASVEAVRPAADARRIRVHTELSAPGVTIFGDHDRLQQVVWNLLTNAIKFTPEGGRVDVATSRGTGGAIQIRVTDTGVGMAADVRARVFERFWQADSSVTRTHGGLGLGLAIVRHLVELHGGTVAVESAGADKGSTFTVRLPSGGEIAAAPPPSRARPASIPPPVEVHAAALRGLKLLIVDDEPDAREMLLAALMQHGAEVMAVASAAESIEALRSFGPDVLLSDIGMPGEDGYELLRKVRGMPAPLGAIPAIALTAYARVEDAQRAEEAGFQHHVAKPVQPASLVQLLTVYVRR